MPNSARRLCSSKPCPESGAIECGLVMWALRSRRRMDSQWMCPVVFTASSQTWGPPKHSESLKHLEMERPLRDLHGLWSTECYSCTWMFSYVFIIFFHIFLHRFRCFLSLWPRSARQSRVPQRLPSSKSARCKKLRPGGPPQCSFSISYCWFSWDVNQLRKTSIHGSVVNMPNRATYGHKCQLQMQLHFATCSEDSEMVAEAAKPKGAGKLDQSA